MAYVANVQSGTVSVIDTTTGTVTATIPVGADPIDMAVSPDGSTVYVANEGSSSRLGDRRRHGHGDGHHSGRRGP